MKLTKANVQEIKRDGSPLEKEVCRYILGEWSDYSDKKAIFTDVLYHGCQSGIVGSLIYYTDTVAFYKRHREEINALLQETMDECGSYNPADLFGGKWDKEDPLVLDTYNQNLLACVGFEETMRKIAYQFDID